jgi:hypothetical protein
MSIKNMNAVLYYKESFGSDLLRVTNATQAKTRDRISIVSLVPERSHQKSFGDTAREFQGLEKKIDFLFCYYFSVLLDQAIHSSLRSEYPHFDHFARYPKFCGILGSYWTNLHPALLLLAATLYTSREDEESITKNLLELVAFFPDDYFTFITERYPKLSGRLTTSHEQFSSARSLFIELSKATALLFQPRSLRPYSEEEPNERLSQEWFAAIASAMNKKLNEIEQAHGENG